MTHQPPMYNHRAPSRRRMQAEAWGVALTILGVTWCLVGGVWLGIRALLALVRAVLGY